VLNGLEKIVELLIIEKPIHKKYRDHELKGNYKSVSELLVYIKATEEKIALIALGSDFELF